MDANDNVEINLYPEMNRDIANILEIDGRPMELYAAKYIRSLQAELAASQRRERNARNELCLKCGRYHEAHKGACDGCRWKEN